MRYFIKNQCSAWHINSHIFYYQKSYFVKLMLYICNYLTYMLPIFTIASDVIVERGKDTSSSGNRIFQTHVNLIILLIGGTITIVLLVLIVFTIRSPRSLVKSNRSDHPSLNVHGIENIYYEFNVVEWFESIFFIYFECIHVAKLRARHVIKCMLTVVCIRDKDFP